MLIRKKIHAIAHTHWDYEWYFTQNESQVQLDYHIDELLHAFEENLLNTYLLDGQSSLIEEHLVNCPCNRSAISKYVKDLRLLIGPWYTQSDLMIISGESIVKNLQIGMNFASSLGHCFDIAYVPDSFGQSQDMPKIFSGFGLNNFVFWRGLSSNKSACREFVWQSNDGSKLTCYNIREGYFPGGTLIWGNSQDIRSVSDACTKATCYDFGVLPVGGDQRYVDFDLRSKIAKASLESERYEYIESTYHDVFDSMDPAQLPTIHGEMLDAENSKIHRSIYSTRYDHKWLNDVIERKLVYTLEPLMAMLSGSGLISKRVSVDNLWKGLLKNHAHDSAGGCNTDKTNFQILTRYINANEQVNAHIDYLIRKVAEATPGKNTLTLFNTQMYPVVKLVRATINTKIPSFSISKSGKKIVYEIEEQRRVYSGSIQRDEKDNDPSLYYYETDIIFQQNMLPASYHNLEITEVATIVESDKIYSDIKPEVKNSEHEQSVEDDYFRVTFSKGHLNLFNKTTGVVLPDFILLADQADDGDNYDYSPLRNDVPRVFDFSNAFAYATNKVLTSRLGIQGSLSVPKEINQQFQRSEDDALLPYHFTLDLANDGLLKCCLTIDNQAKDHRLRIQINTGIPSEHSWSDTQFGCIKRPVRQQEMSNWQDLGWNEEPTGIYPMLNMVNLHNSNYSLSVFTKGIKEYEIVGVHGDCIALTAFRSVGWLGKPGLQRRPGKASGNEYRYIPTPDSQLLKTIECEFALSIDKDFHPAELKRRQQTWACDILHYQKQELNRFTGPLKYFVSNPLNQHMPSEFSFFKKIEFSKSVVCSIFKVATDGKGYVIRLMNLDQHDDDVSVQIELTSASVSFIETDLTEMRHIKSMGQKINLTHIPCGAIKTYLIHCGD